MINYRELRLVAVWSFFIVAISLIPYLYGYHLATYDMKFMGSISMYPEDTNTHLSWAREAEKGNYLIEDKYNGAEVKTRLIFNTLFLTIGWTARISKLPLEIVFHIERSLFSFILLILVYILASQFFTENMYRWLVLILVSISAGFGWLNNLGVINFFPDDLTIIESITFWYIRWEMVVTPTVVTLLLIFLFYLRFIDRQNLKYAFAAGGLTLLLWTIHPHDIIAVLSVLGIYSFFCYLLNRNFLFLQIITKGYLIIVCFSIPCILYSLYILKYDPVLNEYFNIRDPFHPFYLIFGYGILSLLALTGSYIILKNKEIIFIFCLSWLISSLLLLSVPISPLHQCFLYHGIHIPICILSVRTLALINEKIIKRLYNRNIAVAILIIIVFLTSITNIFQMIGDIQRLQSKPFPHFLHKNILEGMNWLYHKTSSASTVIAPIKISQLIPNLSGNRVYAAQRQQTQYFSRKEMEINNFFNEDIWQDENVVLGFLRKHQIDFIFLDPFIPSSQRTDLIHRLNTFKSLKPEFINSLAAIYSVNK